MLSRQPALARHLEELLGKHAEIERALADGSDFCADRMRELSRLGPIVAARDELHKLSEEVSDLDSLASDRSAEADLRDLARAELAEASSKLEELEEELITMLVPPVHEDARNAVLEVRAGVGGVEAGLFAAELFGMYEKFARLNRWQSGPHTVPDRPQHPVPSPH